jgi:gas vesicle protein
VRKTEHYVLLLAGLGAGVAAAVLFAPCAGSKRRGRIADLGRIGKDAQKKGINTMSDLKDQAKKKIDDAAEAAKNATKKTADTAKDMTHKAGKTMEEGGKRLQDA